MRTLLCLALWLVAHGALANPDTLVAALAQKDYPPFYFYDEISERWGGISVDVCERVAEQLGFELEYRRYPFGRLLQSVSAGQADIACTLFNTPQRAPGVTYTSVPHAFENIWVFGREDSTFWEEGGVNWLRQFQVGGIRAYYYGEMLENESEFSKLRVSDEEQLIKVVIGRRVDYALGNKAAVELHAERMGVKDQLRFMERPVYRGPIFIAISREREDAHRLAADFTRAVAAFRETSDYEALLELYGLEPLPF